MKNLYLEKKGRKSTIFCVYLSLGKWWNQGCHGRSQLFASCETFSFNWATKKKFVHVCGIIWDIYNWTFDISIGAMNIQSLPPPFDDYLLRSYLYVICSSFVVIMFSCHFHHLVSSHLQCHLVSRYKELFFSCQAVKSDEDVSRPSSKLILKAL